jgi:hypothetical protein
MIISEEGKSKSRTFVVSSIIKKLDKMNLNGEHSQQRDFIWEKYRQYNLISDILQNNPLPELVFAEQIINNATIIWVIDGKQRCTTLQEFVGNKFGVECNAKTSSDDIKKNQPLKALAYEDLMELDLSSVSTVTKESGFLILWILKEVAVVFKKRGGFPPRHPRKKLLMEIKKNERKH